MKLIAHRGNVYGPTPFENHPYYINKAVELGFDVEIDVWYIDSSFYLGHGRPEHRVPQSYLLKDEFWCHAKNSEALEKLLNIGAHCFWHEKDQYTLTSKGFTWTYPTSPLRGANCVFNQPEFEGLKNIFEKQELYNRCSHVCSDYVVLLRAFLSDNLMNRQ